MLPKTGGVFSYRPNAGPHKLRECLPLATFIRNRLHYALSGKECMKIMMGRMVKVDGKERTDVKYPTGYMDVVTIDKTNENFRLIYDTKGRFIVHRITAEEASYKLCRVKKLFTTKENVPFLATHDGRSIRYPNPDCKVGDTVELDLASNKITNWVKFGASNIFLLGKGNKALISLPRDKGVRKTIA